MGNSNGSTKNEYIWEQLYPSLLMLKKDEFKPEAVKKKAVRIVKEPDSFSYQRKLEKFCLFSLSKLKAARRLIYSLLINQTEEQVDTSWKKLARRS